MSTPTAANQDKLWTPQFIALNLSMLLIFCNTSVFFSYHGYLIDHGFGNSQAGLLISLFALAALIIRPLILPYLQPGNSRRWIVGGVVGTVLCLLAYTVAESLAAITTLRLLHGLFYVLTAAGLVTVLTGCIPLNKSGQAFGVIGVVGLLPFALLPPLVPRLSLALGGYLNLLAVTAIPMAGILLLLPWFKPTQATAATANRLTWSEVRQNLAIPGVTGLLGLSLLMYAAFAATFYFVQEFAESFGLANAGLFFTLATGSEIATRLGLGSALDRIGKRRLLPVFLLTMTAAYVVLSLTASAGLFYGLAVVFGLCWGVVVPATSALLFDISGPRLRAMNTNLGLEMMQGGYFVGPLLGGLIVSVACDRALFAACALSCLLGLGLVLRSLRRGGAGESV